MRRRRKVVIASAAVVALVAAAVVWKIATRKDDPCPGYDVVYDGYGHVSCEEGTVKIQPRSAARKQDTHAGLVVAGGQSSAGKVGASMQTTDQVRDGQPNPWEVGWFLWRYQDPQHFYAVVLKPNGWEVSKQDPAYPGGQRFLASGKTPTFPLGSKHTVTVTPIDDEAGFLVSANGKDLAKVVDKERPYKKESGPLHRRRGRDLQRHTNGTRFPLTAGARSAPRSD